MSKLDWNWDSTHDCEVAFHNGYMIKAERDESPSNPFEDWDGEWPMLVQTGRNGYGYNVTRYEKNAEHPLDEPFRYFNDGQLIHNQVHIAKLLETTVAQMLIDHAGEGSDHPVNYCRDADLLREVFGTIQSDWGEHNQLDLLAEIYELAGLKALSTTSRGYSQGDWANLLILATPKCVEVRGGDIADVDEASLQAAADLYGYWAWGNVYGYTLHAPVYDEAGEVEDWVQLDDSCWGYYGPDHAESGLEENALSALPDEPVRVPDVIRYEEAA
jgi:hypothetical protein